MFPLMNTTEKEEDSNGPTNAIKQGDREEQGPSGGDIKTGEAK
jgi:hypothetical protein